MGGVIVVGIDRSSASGTALRWAADRANGTGCELVLAHVLDDEWGTTDAQQFNAESLIDEAVAAVRDRHASVRVSATISTGHPTHTLRDIAAASDLLVVGTHKTGFFHGRAFGSRGLRLAAASAVPVAVIPEREPLGRTGVVVGIDESAAGDAAIRFATIEARNAHQELTLLLATGADPSGDSRGADPDARARAERHLQLASRATRLAHHESDGVPTRVRTVRRPPSIAIIDTAATAQLLVVGSSRQHGSGAQTLGPVTHDVLFNISTPTVIVHPGARTLHDAELSLESSDHAG
jgi:nucleotide-binding universal stress UspA family protein